VKKGGKLGIRHLSSRHLKSDLFGGLARLKKLTAYERRRQRFTRAFLNLEQKRGNSEKCVEVGEPDQKGRDTPKGKETTKKGNKDLAMEQGKICPGEIMKPRVAGCPLH